MLFHLAHRTGFDNESAQAAYRASGYTNWALAMEKRFSNE